MSGDLKGIQLMIINHEDFCSIDINLVNYVKIDCSHRPSNGLHQTTSARHHHVSTFCKFRKWFSRKLRALYKALGKPFVTMDTYERNGYTLLE